MLITVFIITHNRIELLKRSLNSVIKQTYTDLEIIIVDDCSIDGTDEYVQNIMLADNRIKYIRNSINQGACVSRNKAINAATGKYITGLDDDDWFEANRIELFLNQWSSKHTNVVALFTHYKLNTTAGTKKNSILKSKLRKKIVVQDDLLFQNHMNQIFCETLTLQKISGFNEKLPAWQDLDCWYRLLSGNKKAQLINNSSYIVDVAHEYERISTSKFEKIKKAYNLFVVENKLSDEEATILSVQLSNYDIGYLNWALIFFRVKKRFDFFILRKIILYIKYKVKGGV
ncbi:glycosyltransferase family 2 protein [Acinetobacter indicus]|uniref:glycosyltransferase family 2 protein n=1 Tax=Acinetobacter indicus TaxID=756892 RepID=UPI002574B487|nr:glycosyltransferase family 2 protein [Acinetobacter indicus]MDM1272924.1 glycosyltransferase [Acinetobacter indicus]